MPGYIHHIQWCVSDIKSTVHKLTKEYGFRETYRRTGLNQEVLVQSGSVRFLISSRGSVVEDDEHVDDVYPWLRCKCRGSEKHQIDSVFNICLEVCDVKSVYEACVDSGVQGIIQPYLVQDKEGEVLVAVIQSPCENVIHTLVNTSKYNGSFLPGFTQVQNTAPDHKKEEHCVDLDHVTFVCRAGQSKEILSWYSNICGMSRFTVSQDDEVDTGITISGEAGMRMMVGEWLSEWLCKEQGVSWESRNQEVSLESRNQGVSLESRNQGVLLESMNQGVPKECGNEDKSIEREGKECDTIHKNVLTPEEKSKRDFKLVLAEPLADHPHSHVNTFIQEHGGPGVQHIGLLTPDIVTSVHTLANSGARFRHPPPTYYQLQNKIQDISTVGYNPEEFKKLGILIDREEELFEDRIKSEQKDKFILQLFTHPLFSQNTFFLELIQRQGARGFGAGNIKALAQSIILLQQQQQKSCLSQEESQKQIIQESKIRKEERTTA